MINYSIIIPHKNIPELLQRCLDSIPPRNDTQIIVVDDNSDPSIVNFDHFPGMDNPMVEIVYTKEAKGAGYARNIGLRKATGKWILFADADDFYNKKAFSLYDEYLNSEFDVIYWSINSVYSDTLQKANRDRSINRYISSFLSAKNEDLIRYLAHAPWCKIIRRSLIDKYAILFDEVLAGNDVMFSTRVGHYANKIHADKRKPYCATIRKGSLSNCVNKQVVKSRINARILHVKFLRKIGKGNLEPSFIGSLATSMHCGTGTFFWVLKVIVMHRLPLGNEKIGIDQIKKFFRYFDKRKHKDWEYKVYETKSD